jgi:carboxyl-terminal processing protease
VLVGPNTVSFGEIFSGILKDQGRATLIGETTEGNVEILWGYNFEDGSRAWIAHDTFEPVNHPEWDWEHDGIIVDIEVPADWDEFTFQTDPAIQAALEHLNQ